MSYQFSPSLMCMDLLNFKEQVNFLNQHAHSFHVDIMDGHYVPNITLSPFFIEQLATIAKIEIDVHIMCIHANDMALAAALAGGDCISVHPETVHNSIFRLADEIHAQGKKFGIVINPELPVSAVYEYANLVDKFTVMSVDPGFAGQRFLPQTLTKVEQLRALGVEHNYEFAIQIDGSCNQRNFDVIRKTGADIFIVGASGLFSLDQDIEKAWQKMHENFSIAQFTVA